MFQWLSPILIGLLVGAVTITVTAMINLRIKFASDKESAKRELKELANDATFWVVNLMMVGLLVYLVSKPQPLDRVDALQIALTVGVLLLAVILRVVVRMIDQVYRTLFTLMEALERQTRTTTEALSRNVAITESLVDGLRDRRGRRAGDALMSE